MADFVERDKVNDVVEQIIDDNYGYYRARELIDSIPAADVWEVVYCADCAHAEESLVSGCVYCNEMERARIKEGFCAWGERKANDG